MKKIAALISSLILTLVVFEPAGAMSFSIGSGGTLFFDGVNMTLGKYSVEVLDGHLDFDSNDHSVKNVFFNLSSKVAPDAFASAGLPMPWTKPDPTTSLLEAGRYTGRLLFEGSALGTTLSGEPIQDELRSSEEQHLDLFEAAGLTADIFSGQKAASSRHPVPEPAIMILVGTGLIGLAGYGKKRFKTNKYS